MSAGRRTRLITIVRDGAPVGTNDFNEPIPGPPVTFSRLASRVDASDGETFAAQKTGASRVTWFVVLSDAQTRGIGATDRLEHGGKIWNIQGVKEVDGDRHREIEITAVSTND